MADERYQQPSIGTTAIMVDKERELRIFTLDSGHEVRIMLCENYRPTLNTHGQPSGASTTVRMDKPYSIRKLIRALEELELRNQAGKL